MKGLTEGRLIHYVLGPGFRNAGEHRAAVVRRVFPGAEGICNLSVFLDGFNDQSQPGLDDQPLLSSVYSARYSETKEPGTWHWIEQS